MQKPLQSMVQTMLDWIVPSQTWGGVTLDSPLLLAARNHGMLTSNSSQSLGD